MNAHDHTTIATPAKDPVVSAVQETCILAAVKCSALGLRRTDKKASTKIEIDSHAVEGAARVTVSRLAGAEEHHREILKAQNAAKQALQARSMRFADEDGWRLLPNAQFEDLVQDIASCKADFDRAMDRLKNDAPEIIARAQRNIGTLEVEVPTEEELVSSYALSTEFRPVPDAAQFRNMPAAAAAKLSRQLERQLAQAVETAQVDVMKRFVGPLDAFIERMEAYDQREKDIANGKEVSRAGIFRDSVIGNIHEIYDVLGSFNFTGDDRLQELQNKLASFRKITPDVLRENPNIRSAAMQRAKAVAQNLNDWLSPVPTP
jgi:hypothetical protein